MGAVPASQGSGALPVLRDGVPGAGRAFNAFTSTVRRNSMNASRPAAPSPPRPRSFEAAHAASSYQLSSYELRAGLDIRLLPFAHLPADILRELQRLQICWPQPA